MHQFFLFLGFHCVRVCKISMLVLFCFLVQQPGMGQAKEKTTVSVLPFRVHALQPLDHLKKGLQEMMTVRMANKGLPVINPEVVDRNPKAFQPVLGLKDILDIGKGLGADWVILGSLTQVGRKISLDLKVVDVTAVRPPFSIFMVEDDIDALPDAVERAATSIYNQITGVVQIDSIRVEGNRRIESEAILAVIESKKGEGLDQEKLDKDLRSVYKMGFFKDVNIEMEDGAAGRIVIFKVTEKPAIGQIVFKGNKAVKDADLSGEVGIKRYAILNLTEVKQSINRLKEYYRNNGYYNVKISERIEDLPNNEVSLIYDVEEGQKVYITKIQFVGNTKFDDDDLKDIMETSEKGFLSWITKSGLLDKKKLEFDIHKITSFYHNHGYIRAKAGEPEISYEKDTGLTVTIEIIEGHQFEVNSVKIEGDLIKPEDDLIKTININKEKFFNREVLRKDTLSLKGIYADEGYAYAEVSPLVKEDDKNYLVDITYKITKNNKVRFERINITGNTVTRDKVIRRELKVYEGEYFSGEGLKKSAANLHRLGYFEDVEVQTKKGSRDDLMVLDVNVKERATGSFSLGSGYSSFEGIIGVFQISQRNLFGYGQKLMARAQLGSRRTDFDISFTEPWLFDKPLSAGVDVFKWEVEYDEFVKDSLGGQLTFGYPIGLDDFTRGTIIYRYDDAEISDIRENASQIIKDLEGRNVTSSINLGIRRDSKDKPWNTTKGSVNALSFEYAGGFLAGDSSFNRYSALSAWFFPLPWHTVFLIQGRVGYVRKRSDGTLPVYEKFMLGGINTVRGYEYATISPRDPETGDKIGGEKMWIYNLEYRFPVIKDQGVVGLVFFDAGNVFKETENFSREARRSIGIGARWYSPIGPLRIEYGHKLDRRTGESTGEVEFTVGGSF